MANEKELIKLAYRLGYQTGLCKNATPFSDVGGAVASGALLEALVPGVGQLANSAPNLVGRFDPADEIDNKEYDDKPYQSFIPGVGAYRHGRRVAGASGKHKFSNYFGNLSSTALTTALGAGIGALANKNDRAKGALIGAGAGYGTTVAAQLAAAIAALAKKRRGDAEQQKYKDSSTVPEWLIPGVAAYNEYKTTGYLQGKSKKYLKEKKQKRREEEEKDSKDDK